MKSKICDECLNPFEPSTTNQTTCTQCMIHPHIKKEFPVPQLGLKEKTCVDCNKPYTPTGRCQKRCHECGEKAQYNSKPKPKKKPPVQKTAIVPKQPNNPIGQPQLGGTAMKPFVDLLAHAGCDSIEFVAGDISLSVRRVQK